jgi:cytochrome c5
MLLSLGLHGYIRRHACLLLMALLQCIASKVSVSECKNNTIVVVRTLNESMVELSYTCQLCELSEALLEAPHTGEMAAWQLE